MKIILSRKGVDSASGGIASPIFEDGRMVSVPIPQTVSSIRYGAIQYAGTDIGNMINRLSKGKYTESDGAHCDPDLNYSSLERSPSWHPVFGQAGNAQGHLRIQGVSEGDLFLFFGWFRDVHGLPEGTIAYRSDSAGYHVLWGWLPVGSVFTVDLADWSEHPWTAYHPHRQYEPDRTNTLYMATKELSVDGVIIPGLAGGGVFERYDRELLLTEPHQSNRSTWKLPKWFYPSAGKTPLTFHGKPTCWELSDDHARLKTVGRGQEFVLDTKQYPEACEWVTNIIQKHGGPT